MYTSDGMMKGEHDASHPKDWHMVEHAPAMGGWTFLHKQADDDAPMVIDPVMPDRQSALAVVGVAHRFAQHGGDPKY